MANKPLNVKLPSITHGQINALCEKLGTTKTQLVIMAIDRLGRDISGIPQFRPQRDAEIIKATGE